MRKHGQKGKRAKLSETLRTVRVKARRRMRTSGIPTSDNKPGRQRSAPEWSAELEASLRDVLKKNRKHEGSVDHLIFSNEPTDVPTPPVTDLPIWEIAMPMRMEDF
jgi:hypothetical protein